MVKIEKVIEIYDYYEAVTKDVKALIKEREEELKWRLCWYIHERNGKRYFDFTQAVEDLQNICWNSDRVTGNASGSYTIDTVQAERNLVGNWSLLKEALADFGDEPADILTHGAEWCDVTIRCYLVDNAVSEVLTKYMHKHDLSDLPTDNDDGQDIDPDSLPM